MQFLTRALLTQLLVTKTVTSLKILSNSVIIVVFLIEFLLKSEPYKTTLSSVMMLRPLTRNDMVRSLHK